MEVIQNILIVILAGYMTVDQNGPVVLSWFSVIVLLFLFGRCLLPGCGLGC